VAVQVRLAVQLTAQVVQQQPFQFKATLAEMVAYVTMLVAVAVVQVRLVATVVHYATAGGDGGNGLQVHYW
jgi:hypothetical protein